MGGLKSSPQGFELANLKTSRDTRVVLAWTTMLKGQSSPQFEVLCDLKQVFPSVFESVHCLLGIPCITIDSNSIIQVINRTWFMLDVELDIQAKKLFLSHQTRNSFPKSFKWINFLLSLACQEALGRVFIVPQVFYFILLTLQTLLLQFLWVFST